MINMRTSILVFCAFLQLGNSIKTYEGYKIYEVFSQNENDFNFLRSLENNVNLDFFSPINKVGKPIKIIVAPKAQWDLENSLKVNNIKFAIANQNLEKSIRAKKGNVQNKTNEALRQVRIDITQYYTLRDVETFLYDTLWENTARMSVNTIGQSYEGRNITIARVTTEGFQNQPKIIIEAAINGRDWITTTAALNLVTDILAGYDSHKGFEWIIIPTANPDGYEYSQISDRLWKKTTSRGDVCDGVDLNKNFGFRWKETGGDDFECSNNYYGREAFSEIEARNIRDFLAQEERVAAYVSLQGCGGYVLWPMQYWPFYPWNAFEMQIVGETMVADMGQYDSGYIVGNGAVVTGPVAGSSMDWAKSITYEVEYPYTIIVPCGERDGGYDYEEHERANIVTGISEGLKGLHLQLTTRLNK